MVATSTLLDLTADAPRRSRAFVRKQLAAWDAQVVEHEAVHVVTELVADRVRRAGAKVFLQVVWEPPALRIEVWDSVATPSAADGEDFNAGWRSLGQLASQWGVERRRVGNCVWALLQADAAACRDTEDDPRRPRRKTSRKLPGFGLRTTQ